MGVIIIISYIFYFLFLQCIDLDVTFYFMDCVKDKITFFLSIKVEYGTVIDFKQREVGNNIRCVSNEIVCATNISSILYRHQ